MSYLFDVLTHATPGCTASSCLAFRLRFVFTGRTGQPLRPDNVTSAFATDVRLEGRG
jgi:hypothetical protein